MATEDIKRIIERSRERVKEITDSIREIREGIREQIASTVRDAELRPINILRRFRERYGILGGPIFLKFREKKEWGRE